MEQPLHLYRGDGRAGDDDDVPRALCGRALEDVAPATCNVDVSEPPDDATVCVECVEAIAKS